MKNKDIVIHNEYFNETFIVTDLAEVPKRTLETTMESNYYLQIIARNRDLFWFQFDNPVVSVNHLRLYRQHKSGADKGYWTAHYTANGNTRKKYVGKSENLDVDTLSLILWELYASPSKKK